MHLNIKSLVRIEDHLQMYSFAFLGILILFVFLKIGFNRYFKLILTNDIKSQVYENSYLISLFVTFLSLLVSTFVLFSHSIFPKYFLFLNDFSNFIFVFLILFSIFSAKSIFSDIFFYIIDKPQNLELFTLNKSFYILWRLIILIILMCLSFFIPFQITHILNIILIIIFITYLIEWIFLIFLNKNALNINWYYKILYLCTLEILPLLVIIKVLFGIELI